VLWGSPFPCSMMGFGAWNGGLEPTFFFLDRYEYGHIEESRRWPGKSPGICPFPCSTWKSRGKGRGPSSGYSWSVRAGSPFPTSISLFSSNFSLVFVVCTLTLTPCSLRLTRCQSSRQLSATRVVWMNFDSNCYIYIARPLAGALARAARRYARALTLHDLPDCYGLNFGPPRDFHVEQGKRTDHDLGVRASALDSQ